MQIMFLKGNNSINHCNIYLCLFVCLIFFFLYGSFCKLWIIVLVCISAVCLLCSWKQWYIYIKTIHEKKGKTYNFKVISHTLLAIQFFRVLMTKHLIRKKTSLLIYSFLKYIIRVKSNVRMINIVRFWINLIILPSPIHLLLQH